jgi:hypothetical protein
MNETVIFENLILLADVHKLEEWETLIENDLKSMEWVESDSSMSEDDEDSDEESSDEEMEEG